MARRSGGWGGAWGGLPRGRQGLPRGLSGALMRRLPWWGVVLVLVITGIYQCSQQAQRPDQQPLEPGVVVRVERVIDGDTLLLEDGRRVRLLGVDTPETKHPSKPVEPFGLEASEFTRQQVEGRDVRLEFDRERQDRYQRILAYVYVDGVFLNEALIREGYSGVQTQYPYSQTMKRRFLDVEEEARNQRRGIWSLPVSKRPTTARPHHH